MDPARSYLRQVTRADHERVDAMFAPLDLTSSEDCALFLAAHRDALNLVAAHVQTSEVDLATLITEISRDLAQFSPRDRAAPSVPDFEGHPIGVDYVLSGSHFGAKVLVRKMLASTHADVREATHYLQHAHLGDVWPRVQTRLGTLDDAGLAQAAAGARWTFAVFEAVGQAALARHGHVVASRA